MPETQHYLLAAPARQMDLLRSLSSQTGLSMADCLRRMLDYCLCEARVNDMMPAVSGKVSLGGGR